MPDSDQPTDDGDEQEPTIYANGEPCIIRGIERRAEQYGEAHPKAGEWETFVYAHVDFVDAPDEHTREVPITALGVDGGAPVLNDYLERRGLVPEWWTNNDPVPDSLDE